jgi:hypothetical protein
MNAAMSKSFAVVFRFIATRRAKEDLGRFSTICSIPQPREIVG